MSALSTFIVDPSDEVRERLATGLDGDDGWIGQDSLEELAQSIDNGAVPAVVILGPGIVHDDAIVLAESVQAEHLPVALVQVAKTLEPDRLRDAIRAGLSDVIENHGGVTEELADAVRRARARVQDWEPPRALSADTEPATAPIIAVAAGKGGVGASLIAANLAVGLGSRDLRVGLIDLDVRGGDLSIMLQIQPKLSVLDALGRVDRLDTNAIDGYLTPAQDGVRVLGAPVKGEHVYVDPDDFDKVLDLVAGLSDVIVVDLGDTFQPVATSVMSRADAVVVVTTMDVPAVRGARRVLGQLAREGKPESRVVLVANESNAQTGLTGSDIERTLETTIATGVPFDKHARRSVNEGDPLMNRRRSKAAKAIGTLARDLIEQLGLAD